MEEIVAFNERVVVSNDMYIIVKDENNISFIAGRCKMEGNGGKIMRNIVRIMRNTVWNRRGIV